MPLFRAVNRKLFNSVHANNLIYNTCWKIPAWTGRRCS